MSKREAHLGAKVTADLLKAFAFLWIVVGAVAMIVSDRTFVAGNGQQLVIIEGVELGASLLGAAMLSFFSYVLDLLIEIAERSGA